MRCNVSCVGVSAVRARRACAYVFSAEKLSEHFTWWKFHKDASHIIGSKPTVTNRHNEDKKWVYRQDIVWLYTFDRPTAGIIPHDQLIGVDHVSECYSLETLITGTVTIFYFKILCTIHVGFWCVSEWIAIKKIKYRAYRRSCIQEHCVL